MYDTRLSDEPIHRIAVRPTAARRFTDRTLIQSMLNGDTGAYREFEQRYRKLIYATLHRCHVCEQDQDDIYQELYVRLWAQDLRRLRLWLSTGMRTFSFYLTAIVRHLACDWYRGRHATPVSMDSVNLIADEITTAGIAAIYPEEMLGDFNVHLIRKEQAVSVRKAMGGLRKRDADLIRRKYFACQSYQEIAQTLGISVNNVGVALLNARKRLGHRLCDLHPDLFADDCSVRTRQSKQRNARQQ